MAEPAKPGVSYTIGGVKVDFPVKAYPSQISMMDKVCIAFFLMWIPVYFVFWCKFSDVEL